MAAKDKRTFFEDDKKTLLQVVEEAAEEFSSDDDDEFEDVPFHKHPGFQKLINKRNALLTERDELACINEELRRQYTALILHVWEHQQGIKALTDKIDKSIEPSATGGTTQTIIDSSGKYTVNVSVEILPNKIKVH